MKKRLYNVREKYIKEIWQRRNLIEIDGRSFVGCESVNENEEIGIDFHHLHKEASTIEGDCNYISIYFSNKYPYVMYINQISFDSTIYKLRELIDFVENICRKGRFKEIRMKDANFEPVMISKYNNIEDLKNILKYLKKLNLCNFQENGVVL